MLVIALHAGYVLSLLTHALPPAGLMGLAVLAYTAYGVNAAQFLLKLRAARRQAPRILASSDAAPGAMRAAIPRAIPGTIPGTIPGAIPGAIMVQAAE